MKKQCMITLFLGASMCVASVVASDKVVQPITRDNFKPKFNQAIAQLNINMPQFHGQNANELREYFELVFKPNGLEEEFKSEMQKRKKEVELYDLGSEIEKCDEVISYKERLLIKKRKEFHQNFFSNQKVISIEDQRSTYKNFTILTDDGTHKPLFNEHSDANGEVFDDKKTSLSWETFQEIYFNKKHN